MAYRRPAIEVSQEFQSSAAALSLPTLPACIIGPGFQIADNVNAGIYSSAALGSTLFPYTGLTVGAIADLTNLPTAEADQGVHKGISVTLKNAYLVKAPALPAVSLTTGSLTTPNVFADATVGAFASFDPAALPVKRYYVDVIDAAGINAADVGRKFVTAKVSDNSLKVAAEWLTALPLINVTYRILEFRDTEIIPAEDFTDLGITKTTTGVSIAAGLLSITDAVQMSVVEADVYLGWRALRPDLAGSLTLFTDLDSLKAVFGTTAIVPANIGAYAVNLALQNTAASVGYSGLDADWVANEELAYQSALEFVESKDVYAIATLTQNTAVHQLQSSHVTALSVPSMGRERVSFISRKLSSTAVVAPASGVGTRLSAGASNGIAGVDNKVFKDITNGVFVTEAVRVGHFLEITSYTAVAGSDRAPAANERDFLLAGGTNIVRVGNAAFVGGDVGKVILVRGATTAANSKEYTIASIVSSVKAGVTQAPGVDEVLPAAARAWITSLDRSIAHNAADAVVALTKTWSFVNGAFVAGDVGRLLFMAGAAAAGNNGVFKIATVVSPTVVTTEEAPSADETFGVGVTQKVYQLVREPVRDATSDSVVGSSRTWTLPNALFTAADVGRTLRIASAQIAGNNADHIIEAVLSSSQVRTTNATTPVTEEFNGLLGNITIDIRATTPNDDEAEYITSTRHEIASIVSETQLTLASDPTAGFGGTLTGVVYRITRDLTRDEEATLLAGYATSFANRRLVSVWPDVLAISVGGVVVKVPGYMAGAVIAGMTAGFPSQQGFTNMSLSGFVGRENSDDRFTDVQLDTIAGGGNMVLTQPVADAALSVRHQLTTDVSTIYFQEFSVTKNLDLIARFFRGLFRPFLGIYNIDTTLIDMLKTRAQAGIDFLKGQRQPRIGAPLRGGQLTLIQESTDQPDSLETEISCDLPLPLNNVTVKLLA